jgi:hypothetical protein
VVAGLCALWIKPSRFRRVAILFKPTLLSFHRALVQRKYRLLFSPKQRTKPGPKGPTADLSLNLGRFHRASLRILGVTEVKTVPYIPGSHPFIERLMLPIGGTGTADR